MPHNQHNVLVSDEKFVDLNPVLFGYQDCSPGHYYGPTVRIYWLIHYVVSGKGVFEINGVTYQVSKGMMFVIPPYVQTFYQSDKEQPWSYIWIGFTAAAVLPMELSPVIDCPQAGAVFQSMKNCASYENGRSAFLSSKLWELFACLKEREKIRKDPVEQALFMIHSEYMTELSIQELAGRLNLNRSYFSAIFKDKTGVSPGKYLLNFRMERAVQLLKKHGCSVTVTANSVGYSDVFTFSKMFKRVYGCSPNAFVKKQKEGM